MKGMILGALAIAVAVVVAAGLAIHAGLVDVAADTPHRPEVARLIAFARERSIERRAHAIIPPADLDNAERVRRGAGNYDAMCVGCHLSPGMENSEIRAGLYPAPPDLTRSAEPGRAGDREPARRFWIIKHGIKASAMPAWSKGGVEDEDIWDLVAFLKQLPNLSPDQYRNLIARSPGHSHSGQPPGMPQPAKPHEHGHSHSHAH